MASCSDFDKVGNPEGKALSRGVGAGKCLLPKNNVELANSNGKEGSSEYQPNSAGGTISELQKLFIELYPDMDRIQAEAEYVKVRRPISILK